MKKQRVMNKIPLKGMKNVEGKEEVFYQRE
jgi:hypothetical protein